MSHKSEAMRLVSRAHRAIEAGGRVDAAALAALANAEATLALAEQQRVANIIALSAASVRAVRMDMGLVAMEGDGLLTREVAELLSIERVAL